jgi:O-antigen/teichoic acid export membrane protein
MIFLYLLSSIANRAVTLVGIIVISYLLPADEFGRYALGAANALLLQLLFGSWLSSSANRIVATTGELRTDLISTSALATTCLTLGATLIASANALLPTPPTDPTFFALVLGWALALIIYDVTLNVLNALARSRAYAALSLCRNMLALTAASGGALLGWGAEGALAGQMAGTILPLLLVPAARQSWARVRIGSASALLLRRKLALGIGGTLFLSLYVALSFSGRNMVGLFFGKAAVGHWALATDVFYGPVAVLGSSWALAAVPELYRHRHRRDAPAFRAQSTRFLEMMLYVAVPYAAAGMLLGAPLSLLIFEPEGRADVAMLAPWAAVQSAAILMLYVLAAILMVYERFKLLAVMVVGTTVVNALAIGAAGRIGAGNVQAAMMASAVETLAAAVVALAIAAAAGVFRPDARLLLRIVLATAAMVIAIWGTLAIVTGPAAVLGAVGLGGAVYAALTPRLLKSFLARSGSDNARTRTPAAQA